MKRHLLLLALALMSLCALVPTTPANAQTRERCFRETGFCVSGPILDYWERNGGLPVFGFPTTPLIITTVEGNWTGPVQWFERDRLEDHSAQGEGVLAGRLGVLMLELEGRPWPGLFSPELSERQGCRWFAATQRNLCQPFLNYWERNGGLMRFGYPITPAFEETTPLSGGATWHGVVQYFERRRMEYHPELKGTVHEILLGLLGREILSRPACPMNRVLTLDRAIADQRPMMGCPTHIQTTISLATQEFAHGRMMWVPNAREGRPLIFVLVPWKSGGFGWRAYEDTYREGEDIGATEPPPPGSYAPVRGFGKLWWSNPELRGMLGWPTAPEAADTGASAFYNHSGAWMIYRRSVDKVTVMFPNGRAAEMP